MERDSMMLVRELVRIAKDIVSMDFPSKDAMEEYFGKHPNADRRRHRVVQKKHKTKDLPTDVESSSTVKETSASQANKVMKEAPPKAKRKMKDLIHGTISKVKEALSKADSKESMERIAASTIAGALSGAATSLAAAFGQNMAGMTDLKAVSSVAASTVLLSVMGYVGMHLAQLSKRNDEEPVSSDAFSKAYRKIDPQGLKRGADDTISEKDWSVVKTMIDENGKIDVGKLTKFFQG